MNLESLWLNNNRLKKVNNLEANFRIRTLYLQVRILHITLDLRLIQCMRASCDPVHGSIIQDIQEKRTCIPAAASAIAVAIA